MSKHSERTNFIVWCLWLIGFSERSIGQVTGLRRKQVSGLVGRSPYSNRSAMSDEDRQEKLYELLQIRVQEDGSTLDDGVLDKIPMKIIPLRAGQQKG